MKSIARIPVVGIALWACSALSDESVQYSWAFSGGNLVANGSFENESRETCDPQASPSGVEVNCQNVDHAAFSGSRALTITVPSASLPSPAAPHKTDFLRVEPGGIYTLSFQYGILFGSVSGFRPQVEMFDEARNLVAATCPAGVPVTSCADFDYYHNVPLADLGKWKPFRATFTTHSNATFIRVSLLTYKQASTFLAGMKFDDLALTPGSSPSAVIETKAYGDASGKADRMISSDANRDAVSYVIHDNQRRPVKEYLPLVLLKTGGLGDGSPIVVGSPNPGEALIFGFARLDEAYDALRTWVAARSQSEISPPIIHVVVDTLPGLAPLGSPPREFINLVDKDGNGIEYEVLGVVRGTPLYDALVADQAENPPLPPTSALIPSDPSTLTAAYAQQYPGESNYYSEHKYYNPDDNIHPFSQESAIPGSSFMMSGGHTDKNGWGMSAYPNLPSISGGSPESATEEEGYPVETEVGNLYQWRRDRQGEYTASMTSAEGILLATGTKVGSAWTITEYEYDSFNRPTSIISPEANEVQIGMYDGQSRPILVDDPDRGTIRYRYNEKGWLRYEVPDNGTAPPSSHKMLAYKYDALGRTIESGSTALDQSQSNAENSAGFPSAHLEHGAIFDELSPSDWLARTGVALSATGLPVASLKLTAGNLVSRYFTNPDFTVTGYSADRRLVACFYSHDSVGRVDTLFRYIGAIESAQARLQKIGYAFDDMGRVISKKLFANGTSSVVSSATFFAYDGNGRVSRVLDKDGNEVAAYAYDPLDRLESVSLYGEFAVRYGYAMRGELSSIEAVTLGSEPHTIFSEYLGYEARAYDHPNIPEMGGEDPSHWAEWRFTPKRYDGRLSSILRKMSSDVSNPIALLDYRYDEFGRLLRAQTRKPITGGALKADGNIDFAAISFPTVPPYIVGGPNPANPNVSSETFNYDADGAIQDRAEYTGFEGEDDSQTDLREYSYRLATHQMDNITKPDGTPALRKDGSLLAATGGNFLYDARGRVLEDKGSHKVFEYGFYLDVPLRILISPPGETTRIYHQLYDENMIRVAEIEEAGGQIQGSKAYVHEAGADVVREFLTRAPSHPMGEASLVKSSILGAGEMFGVVNEATGDKRLFVKDHQGSAAKVLSINSQGGASFQGGEEYAYWAYGLPVRKLADVDDLNPRETYTGKEFDWYTGLSYFGARYYDPELGLWLSPDGMNVYPNPYVFGGGQAGADPANFTDPDGDCPVCIVIGLAVVGAYLGGSAANGTYNPLDWDPTNPDTYVGALTGAAVGALAGWGVAGGLALGVTTLGGSTAMGAGVGAGMGYAATANSQVGSGVFDPDQLLHASLFGAATGAMTGYLTAYSGNWFSKALLNASVEAGQAWLSNGDPAKAAAVGFASGAFINSTGPGSNLFLRLGKQAVATGGTSIGRNWAYDRDLFSKVEVGIGPATLVVGKDAEAGDQWRANRTAILLNGFGLVNALAPSGSAKWDWGSLSASYAGGALSVLSGGWTGAGVVAGYGSYTNAYNSMGTAGAHENIHIWDSRSYGFGRFVTLWALSGGPHGNNYYEDRANHHGHNMY